MSSYCNPGSVNTQLIAIDTSNWILRMGEILIILRIFSCDYQPERDGKRYQIKKCIHNKIFREG